MFQEGGFYNHINSEILSRIPLNSKIILEIGCGAGALGQAYKEINPKAKYFGVEINSEAAALAVEKLDKVINIDIEKEITLPDDINKIDCIIYGDIIKHLRDPYSCIKKQLELLNKDAVFLACIPNIQNWSAIYYLLNGIWPRNYSGLFDRTHLQCFTKQSIIDLIEKLGLSICEIQPLIYDQDKADLFFKKIEPILENFNVEKKNFHQNISALQYIVTAKKGSFSPKYIDILVTNINKSIIDSRILTPYKGLNTLSDTKVRVGYKLEIKKSNINEQKIMIFHRVIHKSSESDIFKLKKILECGYLIVIDFDDSPMISRDIVESNFFTFKACHAIQTSNNKLANLLKNYNTEVKVFENCINSTIPKKTELKNESKITIFFGAFNRIKDWERWIGTLNEIFLENPNRWKFEVVHDKAFFKEIQLSPKNKHFTPTCSYREYLKIMKSCDIAFMPLNDNEFNNYKSDLKAIEAASYSLAILSTPVVYNHKFIDKETAAFFNSNQELFNILKQWEENPHKIRELGKRAQEYVSKERLVSYQINEMEDWYTSIWNRRKELTNALRQRIPILFEDK